ncbi:MAG: hypothetical protein WCR21_05760 [Bacteroidota bacterium]
MKNLISSKQVSSLVLLLFTLVFSFIGSTCKPKDTRPYGPQYEEDPGPEKGTTAERLDGSWHIEDYLLNGNSIITQPNVVTSGSISIENVKWVYSMPTKSNDWHESYLVFPWNAFGMISRDSITYSGDDTTFAYWFLTPLIKSGRSYKGWTITKLYQGSLHIKRSTAQGIYGIYWKK